MRNPAGSTAALQSSHWGIAHPPQAEEAVVEDPEKVVHRMGTGKDAMTPAGIQTHGPTEWSFTAPGADEVDKRLAVPPIHCTPPYQPMRNPAGSTAALQSSHWGIAHPDSKPDPITAPPVHYTPKKDNSSSGPAWWG